MAKIKIIKDNAILSIEEEEFKQYEARGYQKFQKTEKNKDNKDKNK